MLCRTLVLLRAANYIQCQHCSSQDRMPQHHFVVSAGATSVRARHHAKLGPWLPLHANLAHHELMRRETLLPVDSRPRDEAAPRAASCDIFCQRDVLATQVTDKYAVCLSKSNSEILLNWASRPNKHPFHSHQLHSFAAGGRSQSHAHFICADIWASYMSSMLGIKPLRGAGHQRCWHRRKLNLHERTSQPRASIFCDTSASTRGDCTSGKPAQFS